MTEISARRPTESHSSFERTLWGVGLIAWGLTLCLVPDPRPLGAPDWAVQSVQRLAGISEPGARAIATIFLRAAGLALLGILVALFFSSHRFRWAALTALIAAPMLAVLCQWINYGYFPIYAQIQLGVASSFLGALAGLALRRNRIALVAFVVIGGGIFIWGTSTGISNELNFATRATGQHVLENTKGIPNGDEGFAELIREAFKFAADNSHRKDAILPNQAAILALGVIVGEETVAKVANRPIDLGRLDEFKALRNRIKLRGRNDLARQFWVSAALTILSDESRSMTVGIGKELMDATPGGSGFSFVDLTADRAGTLFAELATRDAESAREMQKRIRSGLSSFDLCPDIEGLPEGLSRDQFQTEYGGLGGAKTEEIVKEIQQRLATCQGLSPIK